MELYVISHLQEILIKKMPGERLGMNIKGGVGGSPGNPLDKTDEGIFISKININGAANRDGRLRVSYGRLHVITGELRQITGELRQITGDYGRLRVITADYGWVTADYGWLQQITGELSNWATLLQALMKIKAKGGM